MFIVLPSMLQWQRIFGKDAHSWKSPKASACLKLQNQVVPPLPLLFQNLKSKYDCKVAILRSLWSILNHHGKNTEMVQDFKTSTLDDQQKTPFFGCYFFEGSRKKHISNTTKRLGPHLPDLNLTMKLGPDVEKVNMLFRAKENGWLEDEISFWDGLFFKGYVSFRQGTTLPPISNVQWNMGYLEYEFPFIPGYFRLWWLGEKGYLLLVVEPSWKTSLSNLSSVPGAENSTKRLGEPPPLVIASNY